MGKPKKSKTKFNYDKNRKRQRKKGKKIPSIQCPEIKKAWNKHRSVKHNMAMMGLSADPNKTLAIPKAKDLLGPELEETYVRLKPKAQRADVAEALETEANLPRDRNLKLSEPEANFCIYMMERYDEDYKAMARDERNYYQETPKQIRRKIMTFKSCPVQYKAYLASKKSSEEMDTT